MTFKNTHEKFKTIDSIHFDWCFKNEKGSLEYPSSGLMLVECRDGKFYLEQEFGNDFSNFPGIVKSSVDIDTEPTFFTTVEKAGIHAFNLMKEVFPKYTQNQLDEWLADE